MEAIKTTTREDRPFPGNAIALRRKLNWLTKIKNKINGWMFVVCCFETVCIAGILKIVIFDPAMVWTIGLKL